MSEVAYIDLIAGSLGVPLRIFKGTGLAVLASQVAVADEIDRTGKLREWFSKRILDPLLERFFPELYWEPLYLCSPRGRVWIRRKQPVRVEWK